SQGTVLPQLDQGVLVLAMAPAKPALTATAAGAVIEVDVIRRLFGVGAVLEGVQLAERVGRVGTAQTSHEVQVGASTGPAGRADDYHAQTGVFAQAGVDHLGWGSYTGHRIVSSEGGSRAGVSQAPPAHFVSRVTFTRWHYDITSIPEKS